MRPFAAVFMKLAAATSVMLATLPRVPAAQQRRYRLLFDEAHFNYHTTRSYAALLDFLSPQGFQTDANHAPFTPDRLARYDVVIIANPLAENRDTLLAQLGREFSHNPRSWAPALSPAECDAVESWVAGGGGLLLVADHYPYGAAAQILAERFGLSMVNGVTIDTTHALPRSGGRWLVFTRENGFLGEHPITNGRDSSERVRRVVTFTGQSLGAPANASALLRLSDQAFDIYPRRLDGSQPAPTSAATRAQAVALKFGRGRVVVLGEAFMLADFSPPDQDNARFAQNALRWLVRALDP
jgi:hypothetical protein